MRIALTGGTVVKSLSPPQVARTDLVVSLPSLEPVRFDGRVAGFGVDSQVGERIDCSGCVVIPGLVCAHHHLYSSLARGMPYGLAPPRNFLQILKRIWWRLDRAMDPEIVHGSALVGGAEALLAGTTTIVDHHASPNAIDGSLERIADALVGLGVRSALCYEVSDRDGSSSVQAGVEENRKFLKDQRPLTRGMVGAHASFTLSAETLTACVELAREFDVGLHVHVAEDIADQRDSEARFGMRVVERLAGAGALGENSLLAHCIHLSRGEIRLIQESRATVVHNAQSNMNNGVGHAPVQAFAQMALGTDGIGGDMFTESKAAYWRAREANLDVIPQWSLERLADSARFAAIVLDEPMLGTIQPGAPADLVVLEYDPPTPLTDDSLAVHWVFGLTARHVRDVMVAGHWVVRNRRLVRTDEEELAGSSRELAERLWLRMEEIGEHSFLPAGSG